jgi:hypothetical protein
MKAGEIDFAMTMNGPNDYGKHELLTFLRMKKGSTYRSLEGIRQDFSRQLH